MTALPESMVCSLEFLCSGARLIVPSDRLWTVGIRSHRLDHNRSNSWTMDVVYSATSARPCMRGALRQLEGTTHLPSQPQVKPTVSRMHFVEKPLYFRRINPRYSSVQKNFYSIPFSSNLAPVFSRFSARSPRTRYSTILFKFKFVLFIEMPLHLNSCITFAF